MSRPQLSRSRRGWSLALALAVLFTAGFSLRGRLLAFLLNGSRWPGNTDVVMYLQLGAPNGTLLDGSTSWGQSVEDAMAIWNGNLGSGVKLTAVRDASIPIVGGDRKNSVFFGSDIFGEPLGSDTLAITLRRFSNGTNVEADMVFNNTKTFNSYRGPLRQSAGGGRLYDFHRVALHELGHVLGLGHPDDDGQRVIAIMNASISDVDAPQADDIAGVQAIYGLPGAMPTPSPTPTPAPTPFQTPMISVVGDPTRGGFVLSRAAGTFPAAMVVFFHNGGSAVVGQDYEYFQPGTALGYGISEIVVPVRVLPGANRNRKVKLFLDPDPNGAYTIGKAQSKVFLSDLP